MSIVLLITFESSKVIVSRARLNLLIYFLFMCLSMQFELMVVIVSGLCFLLWLMFIIINLLLMVLDNWLTLMICDRFIPMWLNYSFVVSIIIASVIVILSSWGVLDPVLLSDRRFAVLVPMMRIPLTSILLLLRVSMFHHSGLMNLFDELHVMADRFSWIQVYMFIIECLILDIVIILMLIVLSLMIC